MENWTPTIPLASGFNKAVSLFPKKGVVLEFGVAGGNSFSWLAHQIVKRKLDYELVGFDSWEGLPAEAENVWRPDCHAEGNYKNPQIYVLEKLADLSAQFLFVDGFFSETLTKKLQTSMDKVVFVNIDVDLYISCKQVLEFITPLLQVGTILYFDDWKDPEQPHTGDWGEHLAFKEWSEANLQIKTKVLYVNKYNQRCIEVLSV